MVEEGGLLEEEELGVEVEDWERLEGAIGGMGGWRWRWKAVVEMVGKKAMGGRVEGGE